MDMKRITAGIATGLIILNTANAYAGEKGKNRTPNHNPPEHDVRNFPPPNTKLHPTFKNALKKARIR